MPGMAPSDAVPIDWPCASFISTFTEPCGPGWPRARVLRLDSNCRSFQCLFIDFQNEYVAPGTTEHIAVDRIGGKPARSAVCALPVGAAWTESKHA